MNCKNYTLDRRRRYNYTHAREQRDIPSLSNDPTWKIWEKCKIPSAAAENIFTRWSGSDTVCRGGGTLTVSQLSYTPRARDRTQHIFQRKVFMLKVKSGRNFWNSTNNDRHTLLNDFIQLFSSSSSSFFILVVMYRMDVREEGVCEEKRTESSFEI